MEKYEIIEISESAYNDTYIIAYISDSGLGVDYTTSLLELKDLLEYHDKNSDDFRVLKLKKGK